MCFSFDGWALAVGHEGALTVWSTEDGTRLVSTVSHTRQLGMGAGGQAHQRTRSDGSWQIEGEADGVMEEGEARPEGSGGGSDGRDRRGSVDCGSTILSGSSKNTLDLVAGGARSLTWECQGYRLLSVGGAGGGDAGSGDGELGEDDAETSASSRAQGERAQSIVAFDFLRRARSNLSSALLSLQVGEALCLLGPDGGRGRP